MRVGSLFSGYGGLDMAVGGDVVWYSEIDPAACTVLAAHHPDVPNLGDITQVDWEGVPPVDVLTGGYPCQPFSHAGKRQGSNDERHLWPYVRDAISALRPRYAVLENVFGHLTLGLADVLADLAAVGYDARWGVIRASDAGAPHSRKRVFIVATEDSGGIGTDTRATGAVPLEEQAGGPIRPVRSGSSATPDPDGDGYGSELHARGMGSVERQATGRTQERQRPRGESHPGSTSAPADTHSDGSQVVQRPEPRVGSRSDTDGRSTLRWGDYGPAIARWEHVLGRPAPAPTVPGRGDRPRLNPQFVEWMMGLPAGHVTGHGLSASSELKMLGNGVVPQQAALAMGVLL